jgi:PHS family inorganic phosphate transporter-like MFS transporter
MLVTNGLTVIGSLGSALLSMGDSDTMFTVIIVCRLILGIGVGGKYPLSAVMASEAASANQHGATLSAKAFFWQTPGAMAPYLVALLLYVITDDDSALAPKACQKTGEQTCHDPATVALQFRILLGFGCIPASVAFFFTWRLLAEKQKQQRMQDSSADGGGPPKAAEVVYENPFAVARKHPELWPKLAGTGLTWMVYDFA